MRIAAFVVGIIGGVAGSLVTLPALILPLGMLIIEGGQFDWGEAYVSILMALAAVFCLLATAGAVLALYRPWAGALLLAISTVGLAVSVLSQPM